MVKTEKTEGPSKKLWTQRMAEMGGKEGDIFSEKKRKKHEGGGKWDQAKGRLDLGKQDQDKRKKRSQKKKQKGLETEEMQVFTAIKKGGQGAMETNGQVREHV